jgi:hypothetical protein
MFIIAKQSVQFKHPTTGDTFPVANGFQGDAPDWIAETDLFKQIAKAGVDAVIQVVGTNATPVDGVPFMEADGKWVIVKDGVRTVLKIDADATAQHAPPSPTPTTSNATWNADGECIVTTSSGFRLIAGHVPEGAILQPNGDWVIKDPNSDDLLLIGTVIGYVPPIAPVAPKPARKTKVEPGQEE